MISKEREIEKAKGINKIVFNKFIEKFITI